MRNEKSPDEISREKQAEALVARLLPAFLAKAKELGLKAEVQERTGSDRIINLRDISTSSKGYTHEYRIVLDPDRASWTYRASGTVTIKTVEPKLSGYPCSRKTVCRKALTKDGELNTAPIFAWLEGVAATKVRAAQYKVDRELAEEIQEGLRRASDAIQKTEIGKDVPPGMDIVREYEGDDAGLYTVRFNDEIGHLRPAQVRAIIEVLYAGKTAKNS